MEVKIQKVSGSPKATAGRKEDRNMKQKYYNMAELIAQSIIKNLAN